MSNSLSTKHLSVCVANTTLVSELDIEFPIGSFTCVLGLNGAGKTLTLHTLAGIRPPTAGTINLSGTDLTELSRRQIASSLGLLLQTHEDTFPVTVAEAILMGGYAQLGLWEQESAAMHENARRIQAELGLNELQQRQLSTLSGGERRRVALATMLLQNPDIWLLDEPTNHLDPQHQIGVMELLATLKQQGKTIIASIHDPLLAARYADYALLLHGDGRWSFGAASELISIGHLKDLYGIPYECLHGTTHNAFVPL